MKTHNFRLYLGTHSITNEIRSVFVEIPDEEILKYAKEVLELLDADDAHELEKEALAEYSESMKEAMD